MSPEWVALSRVLTTGPGPCGIKPGCPDLDRPVWGGGRCGHSYWVEARGLAFAQPGQRKGVCPGAGEGEARQGPARGPSLLRAPCLTEVPGHSSCLWPQHRETGTQAHPWARAEAQTPRYIRGAVDGPVGGATRPGPLGHTSVPWPLRWVVKGPQTVLSPDREAGLGPADRLVLRRGHSVHMGGCTAPLAPAHWKPGAPCCDCHSRP